MRLLVHFHLYYHDQLEWFLLRLANLSGCDYDLVVTYVEDRPESRMALAAFKPDTRFVPVENIGYDIWPFIQVVKSVDLARYDCVLKIHTKAPLKETIHLGGRRLRDCMWRDNLVESLIGSPETVLSNLRTFCEDPRVGMVCDVRFYITEEFREDGQALDRELERLGLKTGERRFCAGTMFMIRPEALGYLKSGLVGPEMFRGKMSSHSAGSMAHVYERVLSIAVPGCGYTVQTVGYSEGKKLRYFARLKCSSLLKFVFSLERKGEHKAKFMTVFGFRFQLDDGPGTRCRPGGRKRRGTSRG